MGRGVNTGALSPIGAHDTARTGEGQGIIPGMV